MKKFIVYTYASLQTQEPPTFMDPSESGSGSFVSYHTHSMPVASLNAIVADEEGGSSPKGASKTRGNQSLEPSISSIDL